ncbi:TetR/AcrR family transcriptional regulator [Streptacidiphilus jiangxiensis]|uniref:DNA-binding transcriptional regulator, AcrR family n=1 Tax=Streptacidiphilus jiangxiensis TaxID=235985 RepID=A0A1H7RAB6_STRJI|nr:TetR/AcrR family transcriptional regulator C-terminal domain-containing protein [Streptacidiphilus jiangxiensis]SEL57089.1 DNA-binding transcriptional regulator, AcrR family [Streptacidiphilus jiangxiensis]
MPSEQSTATAAPPRPVRRSRAPRGSLSSDLILDHALRLLDEKGLDAFSMRALAEDLGVGTMALYTYFRGKDELFRAARDRVLAAYTPPSAEGSWDQRLRAACIAVHELFTGRPAVLRLLAESTGNDDFIDTATAAMDRMLALLREGGLGREDAARAYGTLSRFTIGSALREVRVCARPEALEAFRARIAALPPERFPHLSDLAPELLLATENGGDQYEYGLDLILCGIRALAQQPASAATGS